MNTRMTGIRRRLVALRDRIRQWWDDRAPEFEDWP